jgi:hypothetical protein
MAAPEIINDLLHVLQSQFYPDNAKEFYQSRRILLKAITYPAGQLHENGVRLTDDRYKKIIMDVIDGIKRHGDTGHIRFFAGYFLNCIQKHMKHHGYKYYDEGKQARNVSELTMFGIKKNTKEQAAPSGPDMLANLNDILKTPRPKKQVKKNDGQRTLF